MKNMKKFITNTVTLINTRVITGITVNGDECRVNTPTVSYIGAIPRLQDGGAQCTYTISVTGINKPSYLREIGNKDEIIDTVLYLLGMLAKNDQSLRFKYEENKIKFSSIWSPAVYGEIEILKQAPRKVTVKGTVIDLLDWQCATSANHGVHYTVMEKTPIGENKYKFILIKEA